MDFTVQHYMLGSLLQVVGGSLALKLSASVPSLEPTQQPVSPVLAPSQDPPAISPSGLFLPSLMCPKGALDPTESHAALVSEGSQVTDQYLCGLRKLSLSLPQFLHLQMEINHLSCSQTQLLHKAGWYPLCPDSSCLILSNTNPQIGDLPSSRMPPFSTKGGSAACRAVSWLSLLSHSRVFKWLFYTSFGSTAYAIKCSRSQKCLELSDVGWVGIGTERPHTVYLVERYTQL